MVQPGLREQISLSALLRPALDLLSSCFLNIRETSSGITRNEDRNCILLSMSTGLFPVHQPHFFHWDGSWVSLWEGQTLHSQPPSLCSAKNPAEHKKISTGAPSLSSSLPGLKSLDFRKARVQSSKDAEIRNNKIKTAEIRIKSTGGRGTRERSSPQQQHTKPPSCN